MGFKEWFVILVHAFIGWFLCAMVMMIGMQVTSIETTLFLHAILSPVFFGAVSFFYFKKFHYTAPLPTASIFTVFVIAVDFFLVALVINRSLDMFTSLLGTWIPFALIFMSTYLTGRVVLANPKTK